MAQLSVIFKRLYRQMQALAGAEENNYQQIST
jgi:hypothetical protein